MAINYASKYSPAVDERFKLAAQTAGAVNDDFDFVGVKTVNVYSIPTVGMNDYSRSGSSRYGVPSELENSKQELTLGMDRSFTFTIDRGNYLETQMVSEAGKALRRQIDEVVIPEIDMYRLRRMMLGAGKVDIQAISNNDYYGEILTANAVLTNAKVPATGRMAFIKPSFYNGLKKDSSFVKASDVAQNMLMSGALGMVDGINIFVLPESYMPNGCDFVATQRVATAAPQKLAEYKVHDNPPGINGWLVEGRVYFDAFVLDNKKNAIYVKNSALASITLAAAAGSSGKCKLTISDADDLMLKAGAKLVYKSASALSVPALGADVSSWTDCPDNASFEYTGTAGHKVVVAMAIDGKAYAASTAQTVAVGA